jgi:hypothetical protein
MIKHTVSPLKDRISPISPSLDFRHEYFILFRNKSHDFGNELGDFDPQFGSWKILIKQWSWRNFKWQIPSKQTPKDVFQMKLLPFLDASKWQLNGENHHLPKGLYRYIGCVTLDTHFWVWRDVSCHTDDVGPEMGYTVYIVYCNMAMRMWENLLDTVTP